MRMLWFGNVSSPAQGARQIQRAGLVIAFVRHGFFDRRRAASRLHVQLRLADTVTQRLGVAMVGRSDGGRQYQVAAQVHHVFRFVGQVCGTVFHLGDAAVWVGGRLPVVVTDLLVGALLVEAAQLFIRRVLDARLVGQTCQIRLPIFARIFAFNRLHGRVGFQCGRVNSDCLAFEKLLVGGDFQDKHEHLFVNLQRQALMAATQTGMVRRGLVRRHSQEFRQRAAVTASPGDATLRADPFEVAHQNHAEVHARRDRRPTHDGRVVRLTELLDPIIELGLRQHLIQLPIKWVPRRLGQIGGCNPQPLLLRFAFTQGHRDSCFVRGGNSNPDGRHYTTAVKRTFSTGC